MDKTPSPALEVELEHLVSTYCEKNKPYLEKFGRLHGFLSIQARYRAYNNLFNITEEEIAELSQKIANTGKLIVMKNSRVLMRLSSKTVKGVLAFLKSQKSSRLKKT